MVAASEDGKLVQVATFALLKPYNAALFKRVDKELRARMRQVAAQSGGTVSSGSTVTAGGIRSHRYQVTTVDHVDEYTFVLRARREYQLLCRRGKSDETDFCDRLVRTFAPA